MEMRIRGVQYFRSRHGKWYAYHRKTGKRIKSEPGTAAFLAEIESIERGGHVATPAPKSGTLAALALAYQKSPEFTELAPRTREDYQGIFAYLLPRVGADRLIDIDSAWVRDLRDAVFRKRKRHFANYAVVVLRLLFKWGRVSGQMRDNPAAEVPKLRRPKGIPKANRRWTAEELEIVLAAMPPELKLATMLGVATGMRESDVLTFPWSGYKGGLIQGRAAKTDTPIWMPAHPMKQLLDDAPRKSPIVVIGARGKPFTLDGFRARFFKVIREVRDAGKVEDGLTFHGLRTTTATMLAEAGCD